MVPKDVIPKGSIIYKLLIVILGVGLAYTLFYPQSLWQGEKAHTKQCRDNMEHILYAESVYLMQNNAYTPNLRKAVDIIKNDPTGKMLKTYMRSDSVLAYNIIKMFKKDNYAAVIIDSLQRFARRNNVDTLQALIFDSLRTDQKYGRKYAPKIDSMAWYSLNHLYTCPTTNDTYHIEIVDTSVIKVMNVACPVSTQDSLRVENDFKLRRLGGLTIKNHGRIKDWERSWANR